MKRVAIAGVAALLPRESHESCGLGDMLFYCEIANHETGFANEASRKDRLRNTVLPFSGPILSNGLLVSKTILKLQAEGLEKLRDVVMAKDSTVDAAQTFQFGKHWFQNVICFPPVKTGKSI